MAGTNLKIGSKVKFNVGRGTFVGKIADIDAEEGQAEIVGQEGAVEGKTYYRLVSKLSRA